MSDYLPEELVLKILHHLPPTTLVRFTSVCKAWNTIIKSHAFIFSHLQHSLSNHTLSLLLPSHVPDHSSMEQCSLCSCTTNGLRRIAKLLFFPVSLRIHVVNTVNGVICLSHHDRLGYSTDLVILWNPFIQRHIKLPTPFFTYQRLHRGHQPCLFFVGFGFNSKTNDYKVVRICYPRLYDVPPLVELYSLNEGAWRIIDASSIDVRIVELLWSQCFLHGNVHWLAVDYTHAPFQYCVLMFNVEEENFKKIRLPPELSTFSSHDLTISVINGCLSVINYVHEGTTTRVCNVWMKREPESWNKMYTINLQTGVDDQRVLLASRTNDEIFEVPLCGQFVPLCLFESNRQKITKLGIQSKPQSFYFSEYTASLVLFDRENVPMWCRMDKRCAELVQDEELEELEELDSMILLRMEFISEY